MNGSPAALFAVAACALGCQATLGPGAIRRAVPSYNETIERTQNQQLLLNLVRLRYRDTPLFLEVGSVTTQQTLAHAYGIGADVSLGGGSPLGTTIKPTLGMTYAETPTIVFTPLAGEAFFRRLLQPLPPQLVLYLASSGWSMARVMALAVDRVNDLWNAPSAAGPTPDHSPTFEPFRRLASDLRDLHRAHGVDFGAGRGESPLGLEMQLDEAPERAELTGRVRAALGLSSRERRYAFTDDFLDRDDAHVAVRMRSLLSVLFYLSQAVEPPEEHARAGLVTVTRGDDGAPFDWQRLYGGVFRVRSSASAPDRAYVAVRHRGAWFYVADDDLESKSTFMLLAELFNLQAGTTPTPAPALTLPLVH